MNEIHKYVLSVMSTGNDKSFSPVMVQKLFFILDKEIYYKTQNEKFNFKPYDYGPFDKEVYNALDELIDQNLIVRNGKSTEKTRSYSLSPEGQSRGTELLESNFDESEKKYFSNVAAFVQKCSFSELVTSIYKHYPDMRVNSVFSNR